MHHVEHDCADYGGADYGSASDSVSELARSFIGISRFREIPIPASATSEIDHHHKHRHHDAYTRTGAHGTYTYAHLRAHVLARADAFYCLHG